MGMSGKGASSLISYALIIIIGFTVIFLSYTVLKATIERSVESTILNEGTNNMNILANIIREVARDGVGASRTITFQIGGGSYRVDNASNSIYFTYNLKSNILTPGTFVKQGDIQITVGGLGAAARENSTYFILENEMLKVVLNKTAYTNTSRIINSIENKKTGQTTYPKDSSVVVGSDISSKTGIGGSSKLIISGTGLAQAEVVYHVNSSNYKYNILYSLPSLADYLVVQIQNTTSINSTFTLRYNLSNNGANDIFSIGGKIYNISNITQSCWSQANITDYFSCSYYNSNFSGLIYSGSNDQFLNACFYNSTTDYTFNLTSNSLQKFIIPLASGTCSNLQDNYYLIETYNQPSASFGTYTGLVSEGAKVELRLNYLNIIITGSADTIGKGSHRLCIKKTGISNNLPVVDIRRC